MFKAVSTLLAILMIAAMFTAAPAQAQEKQNPIQLSLFSPIQVVPQDEAVTGIRLSLIYGKNKYVSGFDWGLVSYSTGGVSKGVQFGLVGMTEGDFVGWQDSWINITKGNFQGFQWGVVNYAGHGSGFQLGLVNYCQTMHGIQIGLVNVIKQGGMFPVFPIVNWSL